MGASVWRVSHPLDLHSPGASNSLPGIYPNAATVGMHAIVVLMMFIVYGSNNRLLIKW